MFEEIIRKIVKSPFQEAGDFFPHGYKNKGMCFSYNFT